SRRNDMNEMDCGSKFFNVANQDLKFFLEIAQIRSINHIPEPFEVRLLRNHQDRNVAHFNDRVRVAPHYSFGKPTCAASTHDDEPGMKTTCFAQQGGRKIGTANHLSAHGF